MTSRVSNGPGAAVASAALCPGQNGDECGAPVADHDSFNLCGGCQDDYYENHCSIEGCGESLDGGEGFDGYCGTHADRAEAEGEWDHHDR
jgi:hypothetical protein